MIKQITAEQTKPLRKLILRPDLSMEELTYDGDLDESSAHFGFIEEDAVKGIATLYNSPSPALDQSLNMYRLRGMAVEESLRGKNAGRKLIDACVDFVSRNKGDVIWCDARISAKGFYEKLGFVATGKIYHVKGAGDHYLMYRMI